MDFSNVIFTNRCYATLDGADEWAKCWIASHQCPPVRVRHQQGRRGIMFSPTVIDDGSIRSFPIENDVKIDSRGDYAILNKHFLPR